MSLRVSLDDNTCNYNTNDTDHIHDSNDNIRPARRRAPWVRRRGTSCVYIYIYIYTYIHTYTYTYTYIEREREIETEMYLNMRIVYHSNLQYRRLCWCAEPAVDPSAFNIIIIVIIIIIIVIMIMIMYYYVYVTVYIYIYRERERERERCMCIIVQ